MRTERSAGGVIFKRLPSGIVILVILDSHGNWAFPKGRIEPGETPIQAARREIMEEVGLTELILVRPLGVSEFWFVDRWEQPGQKVHKFVHHYLFEAQPTATAVPEISERIQELDWVPVNLLAEQVRYQTLTPIVTRVMEALHDR